MAREITWLEFLAYYIKWGSELHLGAVADTWGGGASVSNLILMLEETIPLSYPSEVPNCVRYELPTR